MNTLEQLLAGLIVVTIGVVLLHFFWQAALVVMLVAGAPRLLRRSSANVRYLVATVGLFALAATATAAAKDPSSVATQIERLKSDDAKVRWQAANALRTMGPRAKNAVGALAETLGDTHDSMRQVAAEALGNIGPPAAGATGALVVALKDEKYWVRRDVARALGKIGPGAGKATKALIEALRDDNDLVRRFAAEALAAIGRPAREVIDALEAMLKDKEVSGRLAAAEALAKLGEGRRAVDALAAILKHNDIQKRRDAVAILETIGPSARKAAAALLHAVRDAEGWRGPMAAARKISVDALVGSEEELGLSARSFTQSNWRLRFAAARALGKIDPPTAGAGAVPVLIKTLSHDTPWVRLKSAEALGTIGPPAQAATPALKAILAGERHPAVGLAACKTLKLIRRVSPTARPVRGDGLLAWFAADGSAADNAGTNDGRIVGNVKFTTDRHGAVRSALAFNRDGGRVVIPDSDLLDTDDAFTLSAWVMRTHDGTKTGHIVSKWQDRTREGDYFLSMTDAGQVCLTVSYITVNPHQDHVYSNSCMPKGAWTHVAATFDSGEMKLYINGVFDAGKKSPEVICTDWREYEHDDIAIGALWDGKLGFRGAIDEIRIYGRALSASEIYTLFGGPLHITRNAKADRVDLSDGSCIAGTITNTRYVLTTAMGNVTIPAARVSGMISRGNKIKGLQLLLTDSQIISGTLADQVLQVDGPSGKTLKIPPADIVQCGYRITQAKPASSASPGMVLTLRNGDRLAAKLTTKLQLKSPYALMDLPAGSIVRIEATAVGGRVHRVMLANGSRLSGTLIPRTLAAELQLGPKLAVQCEDLAAFSCPGVKRSAVRADAVSMRMANGDCLSGRLVDKTLSLRTEFGDIAPAWTGVESIRPGKNKGVLLLKMRNGAVYRGRLIGPYLSFAVAGDERVIKVKAAQISSIGSLTN